MQVPETIGGVPPQAIAEQFGTPVYVYNADRIIAQYDRLSKAFSAFPHRLHYAMKANSNTAILRLLHQQGAGIDAVSLPEVQRALRAGYKPADILFTPNSVPFEEIEAAIQLGVGLNIDNLAMLEQVGHAYGNQVPVCLRLNPHIYAGGNTHIQTGHIDSKFGISIFQLRHALRIVQAYQMPIIGLHMHTGSDILDAGVFLQAADVLFQAAEDFPDLQYLDFGSGFKVAYRPDDVVTDVEELGRQLAHRLEGFYAKYGRQLDILFEPGKFLVSEAGNFLVTATTVKQTVSSVFVGVNSGLNHFIRPMFYEAYHPIWNVSNPTGTERVYSVVGYICETDTFAADRKLPEVRTGDLLALGNAGAYCFAMASQYNSRPRPAEVLVHKGVAQLIRKRESLEDLLALEVPLEAELVS